eukprot:2832694-Alexandrium_andersonii.AAC.1
MLFRKCPSPTKATWRQIAKAPRNCTGVQLIESASSRPPGVRAGPALAEHPVCDISIAQPPKQEEGAELGSD